MKAFVFRLQRVTIAAIFLLAILGFIANHQSLTGEAAGGAAIPLPAITLSQQASIDGANILLLETPIYHLQYLPLIER